MQGCVAFSIILLESKYFNPLTRTLVDHWKRPKLFQERKHGHCPSVPWLIFGLSVPTTSVYTSTSFSRENYIHRRRKKLCSFFASDIFPPHNTNMSLYDSLTEIIKESRLLSIFTTPSCTLLQSLLYIKAEICPIPPPPPLTYPHIRPITVCQRTVLRCQVTVYFSDGDC